MKLFASLLIAAALAGCSDAPQRDEPRGRTTGEERSPGLTQGAHEPVLISVDAGDREVGGYRIEVVFDNAVVRVISVEADPSFPAPQFSRDQFTAGVLRLVGYVVDPAGPRGLVTVAHVSFEALGSGSSRLTIRLIELVDPEGRPIKGRVEASKDRVP